MKWRESTCLKCDVGRYDVPYTLWRIPFTGIGAIESVLCLNLIHRKDGGSLFFRNVDSSLPNYALSSLTYVISLLCATWTQSLDHRMLYKLMTVAPERTFRRHRVIGRCTFCGIDGVLKWTDSMEQSCGEFTASQEFPLILWNATSPCPEPDQSIPRPQSYFLKIHFNIILPSTSRSSKWSLSTVFSHQNTTRTSPVSHTCYTPRPSYSLFDNPNYFWWAVQKDQDI